MMLALPVAADIFRSNDNGATWEAAGLAGKSVDHIWTDPLRSEIAVAHTTSRPYETLLTTNSGKTWRALNPGFQPDIAYFDPSEKGRLWLGGREGAWALSKDDGSTWAAKGVIPMEAMNNWAMNVRAFVATGKRLIAAGGQGGGFVAWTEDEGATWTPAKSTENWGYNWAAAKSRDALVVAGGSNGKVVWLGTK